jgi:hypothetical protein
VVGRRRDRAERHQTATHGVEVTMLYPKERGVIPYETLRPNLDVFAVTWVGDSPLSRAIRRIKPGGSHSSIGLNLYGTIMLVEAMELGVEPNRASYRFDAYPGDILIHPLEVSAGVARDIKASALKLCGAHVRYGYHTLFALAWRKVRNCMRRPVCSQTVAYILAKHGVLPPQDNVISPGELRALLPAPWRLAPYSKEAD